MRRRDFIAALAGSATAWPLTARAQRPGKVWRIGVLSGIASPPTVQSTPLRGLLNGLHQLGYQEGRDFAVEWRFADGKYDRFPELAADLVRLNVDIVVVTASAGIRAMQQATKTIPIVMGISFDPVGSGLVASLARPGGNTTGLATSQEDVVSKQVELLKTAVPKLSRVAILTNPKNRTHAGPATNAEISAERAGLTSIFLRATSLQEIEDAFGTLANRQAEGLLVIPDSVFTTHRHRIAQIALMQRLPTIFSQREPVEAGGLMSYGESLVDFFQRAAIFVDKIFKGASPEDLPIEQPTRFFLIVNLKTAKAIGLTLPESFLLRADEVIE